MKTKETLHTKKSETLKMPDLRNGMHGSLMIEGLDAGQPAQASDADLKIASPDRIDCGAITQAAAGVPHINAPISLSVSPWTGVRRGFGSPATGLLERH